MCDLGDVPESQETYLAGRQNPLARLVFAYLEGQQLTLPLCTRCRPERTTTAMDMTHES